MNYENIANEIMDLLDEESVYETLRNLLVKDLRELNISDLTEYLNDYGLDINNF